CLRDKLSHSGNESTKSVFLDGKYFDLYLLDFRPGAVCHDIDESVEGVQTAEKIIVLPVAAREKRGKMAKPNAFEGFDAIESFQRTGVLRADAVDKDFSELTNFLCARDRKGQNVPERKTEIVDQNFAMCVTVPLRPV